MATPWRRLTDSLFRRLGIDGTLDSVPVRVIVSYDVESFDEINGIVQYKDTASFQSYKVAPTKGQVLIADERKFEIGKKVRSDGEVVELEVVRNGAAV